VSAARNDDSPWAAEVVLADGGPVHVRPVHPDDLERYEAFHLRQSHDSMYYRFFSARPKFSRRELERLVTVDMIDRATLVVFEGDEMIAVANYDRWPGRDDAEVAFLVDDGHHGRGVATMLLEHLASVARSNGIERFTAEVLADNRPMLSVFLKAGWPVQRAFDSGVIDLVFPLDTTPELIESIERREQLADARSLARLLFPRGVAVVGASDSPGSPGWALLRNLLASGFPGAVSPVNPYRDHVASVASFARVSDVPGPVDLALIAVPAEALAEVLADCAAKRVRGVVINSTIPVHNAQTVTPDLVRFARRHGMRLIGPASMGLLVTGAAPLHAHLARDRADRGPVGVRAGGVAISLQSGPLGASVLEMANRLEIGLSLFVSLGDKADVSGNDLLQYVEDDASTTVVAMYTESFGNPRKFARIARRVARRTPVVAVCAGGASDAPVTEALFRQAGVIPVPTVRDLLDTARVLATQPVPAGPRVQVITNAASPAVLALDALAREGLTATVTDVGWQATPHDFAEAVVAVEVNDTADAVMVIHAPPVARDVSAPAEVLDNLSEQVTLPMVVVLLGGDDGPLRPGSPLPVFTFPEPAAAVLGRGVRLGEWRRRYDDDLRAVALPVLDTPAARRVIDTALGARAEGTLLPVAATVELLDAAGVDVAPARGVTGLDDAIAAAQHLGFPVVLKALGLRRRVRGSTAGVRLDVGDVDELARAWGQMLDVLGDRAMVEVLVQRQVPSGVEVRVAARVEPAVGPVVTVGLGGVHADAIGDAVHLLAPIGAASARDAVAQSRAAMALADAGVDADSLTQLVMRVGELMVTCDEVDTMILNPVIVSAEGAWVTDAAVHVAPVQDRVSDLPVRRL
jgi:acyl-CoA synthetase (NDP forming)/RimJ/RimL family protein N-acetyltransferase